MGASDVQKSLKRVAQAIESLDLDKRVAASKWLEGVIVAQTLTMEERDSIVKAANSYIETVEEDSYVAAVNALISYLCRVQKATRRAIKKKEKSRSGAKKLVPQANPQ